MNPKKVWIAHSLIGCLLNQNHTQRVRDYFHANQWIITDRLLDADLIVYSGCAFLDLSEVKAMEEIQHLNDKIKSSGKKIPIVVTGCLPDITQVTKGKVSGKGFEEIHEGLHCSVTGMEGLDEAISAEIPFHLIPFPNEVSDESFKSSVHLFSDSIQDGPKRRKIKRAGILRFLLLRFERWFALMDETVLGDGGAPRRLVRSLGYKMIVPGRGCKNACSYCSIKFAIGKPKSVPLPEIMEGLEKLLASGEKKFVLFPDDLGSWGLDIGSDWITLLKELVSTEGDFQLSVHNLGASDLLEEKEAFFEIIETKKITSMTIQPQHTNPRILKRMNRSPFDMEELITSWNRMGEMNIHLCVEIIVGFPGETEEEFQDLLTFVTGIEAKNSRLEVFPYSRREGTMAARKYRDDELPENVVLERRQRLISTFEKKYSTNPILNVYKSALKTLFLKMEAIVTDYQREQSPHDQAEVDLLPR